MNEPTYTNTWNGKHPCLNNWCRILKRQREIGLEQIKGILDKLLRVTTKRKKLSEQKILNLDQTFYCALTLLYHICCIGDFLIYGSVSSEQELAMSYVIFKASALWADAFYKSKCPSACPSVRPSVRVFKRLFAPTSQSRMSYISRDSESLGKRNGKKWSQIGLEVVLKHPTKKLFFFWVILPYKTRWKPRFPMD